MSIPHCFDKQRIGVFGKKRFAFDDVFVNPINRVGYIYSRTLFDVLHANFDVFCFHDVTPLMLFVDAV